MNKKDSFLQRAGNFFAGKGFYVVLILCVAVIGASAWAMLSSGSTDKEEDSSAVAEVSGQAALPDEIDAQAADDNDLSVMAEAEAEDEAMAEAEVEAEAPAVASAAPSPSADAQPEKSADESDETAAESPEPSVSEEKNDTETAGISGYVWPVSGEILVYHTTDELIYDKTMSDWRTHTGLDIASDLGAKVIAISSGTVESIFNDDLYGTTVVIDHGNDLKSVYSNLAATPTVSEGQSVATGETIGAIGGTALAESGVVNHLHLDVLDSGAKVDPLDYLP